MTLTTARWRKGIVLTGFFAQASLKLYDNQRKKGAAQQLAGRDQAPLPRLVCCCYTRWIIINGNQLSV